MSAADVCSMVTVEVYDLADGGEGDPAERLFSFWPAWPGPLQPGGLLEVPERLCKKPSSKAPEWAARWFRIQAVRWRMDPPQITCRVFVRPLDANEVPS